MQSQARLILLLHHYCIVVLMCLDELGITLLEVAVMLASNWL